MMYRSALITKTKIISILHMHSKMTMTGLYSKGCQNWIAQKRVKVFSDCSSQSLDFNPIEHLWSELKKRHSNVLYIQKIFMNLRECCKRNGETFHPKTYIKLIESMSHRIEACI